MVRVANNRRDEGENQGTLEEERLNSPWSLDLLIKALRFNEVVDVIVVRWGIAEG